MHSTVAYVIAAAVGLALAHFLSRAPELRTLRLSQLVLVPAALVVCVYFLPRPGESGAGALGQFPGFLAGLFGLIVLLAPNLAHHIAALFTSLLDPQDWTPLEEEISLRPIRRLIENDKFSQAQVELEELLKKHKPTYEALLLRAKLFHHLGNINATVAALLAAIPLSHTTDQQVTVLEMLALLEDYHLDPPRPAAPRPRRIEIRHELVLFPTSPETATPRKAVPAGTYDVSEIFHRNHRWLKLAAEDWGNAEMCWEAVAAQPLPSATRGRIFVEPIARMHEAIAGVFTGGSHRHSKAESRRLLKEANEFIRRDDWRGAVPLLQQACERDPDHYEIAYRWAQAVQQTGDVAATGRVVDQVLNQSRWSESECQMLEQLRHSQ